MTENNSAEAAFEINVPQEPVQTLDSLRRSIVIIDDKEYIDLQYFVDNQQFVINNAKLLRQIETTEKHVKTQSIAPRSTEKEKFKWEVGQQTIFAIVVTGLGINQARPKEILPLMPNEYCLDQQMIASHLQKYRQKIIKDYQLNNMSEIQNYQYPEVLKNQVLEELSRRWKEDRTFTGLNELEIKEVIKGMQ